MYKRQVQGWLVLPEAAHGADKLPLVTVVHGGPASAFQPNFLGAGRERLLLEHGYALFLPNPRGSYGQGEGFTRANVRDFGYGDLRDILAGLDAAARAGPIDPEKMGITGHSYGGFMTVSYTHLDVYKRQGKCGPACARDGRPRAPSAVHRLSLIHI